MGMDYYVMDEDTRDYECLGKIHWYLWESENISWGSEEEEKCQTEDIQEHVDYYRELLKFIREHNGHRIKVMDEHEFFNTKEFRDSLEEG